MTSAATPRARFGIAGTWRDAWKIAESNPLLLLVGLALLAGTAEACAQSGNALAAIPVAIRYGYAVAWLMYYALLAINYVLIAGVAAGIALVMLVKAEPGEAIAPTLRRPMIMHYFLRVIVGWLCILGASLVAGFFVNVANLVFLPPVQEVMQKTALNIAVAIMFSLLQAGFASLVFWRLPETLSGGARRAPLRGERRRFFLLYATSFLATGLTVGLAWVFWASSRPYLTSTRIIDWKIALDALLIVLLTFAARRQPAAPEPGVAAVFD